LRNVSGDCHEHWSNYVGRLRKLAAVASKACIFKSRLLARTEFDLQGVKLASAASARKYDAVTVSGQVSDNLQE
jgi:hypothetical protein